MALNTITQIRLPNGKEIDIVDWTDKPLWSSVDLQTGFTAQDITLFNYVNGDTVPGFGTTGAVVQRTATDNDTNLATPGAMASTEEMLVYAIKPEVFFYTNTPNDFTTRSYLDFSVDDAVFPTVPPAGNYQAYEILNQQLLLRLFISQKIYAEAGFGYFNRGFGALTSAGTLPNSNNGLPSQEAIRSFVIPHHIGSQEKYRVQLANTSTINNGAVQFGAFIDTAAQEGEIGITTLPEMCATIRLYLDGLYKRPTA